MGTSPPMVALRPPHEGREHLLVYEETAGALAAGRGRDEVSAISRVEAELDPTGRALAATKLVGTLARLHALDPEAVGLA